MSVVVIVAGLAACAVAVLAWVGIASRRRKPYTPPSPTAAPPTPSGDTIDSLLGRGERLFVRGAFADALALYEQALALMERAGGVHHRKGSALKNAGEALQRLGRLDEAKNRFTEAQRSFQAENNPVGETYVIKSLGNLHLQNGDPGQAIDLYAETAERFRSAGHPVGVGFAFKGSGDGLHKLGRLAEARQAYEQAVDLFRQTSQVEGVAETLLSLGEVLLEQEDKAGALAHFEEAKRLYDTHGIVSFANRAAARIAGLRGDASELERAIALTVRLCRENPQMDDWDVALQMIDGGMQPAKAWQLVMFVPLAYGRTVLDQMGASLDDTVTVLIMGSDERRVDSLAANPVYIAAYRFARQERLQGVADEAWKNIFRRSPEVSAMNQALANGVRPDDLLISAPVLTAAPEHVAPVSWN